MIEILFWVLLVVWAVFGLGWDRERFVPGGLLPWFLFLLLGLTVFHNPLAK